MASIVPMDKNKQTPNNKVARLLEKYSLGAQLGEKLENEWTGQAGERKSLRDLATMFNERLLEAAMIQAGESPLEGEVRNLYKLLTEDDVTSGSRTEARQRLEHQGIDIEQLQRDFVTYQAIRSYLKNVRNTEYNADTDGNTSQRSLDSVRKLQSKLETVANSNLNQLDKRGEIHVGEYLLSSELTVFCQDCGRQFTYDEIVKDGGCECESDG